MAGAVKQLSPHRSAVWATTLALGLACAPAWALGPLAPFTPPPAAAAASAAQGGATAAPPADKTATGFSGVRLAQNGTQALIDGQWWALGSTPRGARLLAVRGGLALLRHADGRVETLLLYPGVAPTAAGLSPPAKPTTGATR
jgi:hypothetical protein